MAHKAADEVRERLWLWDSGAVLPGFLFDHGYLSSGVLAARTPLCLLDGFGWQAQRAD